MARRLRICQKTTREVSRHPFRRRRTRLRRAKPLWWTIVVLSKDDHTTIRRPPAEVLKGATAGTFKVVPYFLVRRLRTCQKTTMTLSRPACRNCQKPFGGHIQLFSWRDDTGRVERRSSTCLAPFLESLSVELPHEGTRTRLSKDALGHAPSPLARRQTRYRKTKTNLSRHPHRFSVTKP